MPATNAYVTTLRDQVRVTCSYIQLHCKVQEHLAQKQRVAHLCTCLDEEIFISFKLHAKLCKILFFLQRDLTRIIQVHSEYMGI